MAGGFGFSNYAAQRPTPNAQQVGMALVGRRMEGGEQASPMVPPPAPPSDEALRLDGARRMGAPGQIDDTGPDTYEHSTNAINVAVGEALTRMGGGYATNKDPFKDRERHIRNLQHLGLSEVEAHLLAKTGGI